MMKPNIKSFASLLLIVAFVVKTNCQSAGCNKNPESRTVANLTESSGKLKINGTLETLKDTVCQWNIVANGSKQIFLQIEDFLLGQNDNLFINDNSNKTILALNGFQLPGVVLTGYDNISIYLILSPDGTPRRFDVNYDYQNPTFQLQDIAAPGSFIFAYYNETKAQTIDYTIIFQIKQNVVNQLLRIDFDFLSAPEATLKFEGTANANGSYDSNNRPPDLLSNVYSSTGGRQIKVTINGFKASQSGGRLKINYHLVSAECSQYQVVSEYPSSFYNVLPTNFTELASFSSLKCFKIFEHKDSNAKWLLNINNFTFINELDSITILDGNNRSSPVLGLIVDKFLNYWQQVFLYSTSNKIWILYDSPNIGVVNVSKIVFPFGVQPRAQGGTNVNISISSKSSDKNIPIVYTFVAEDGKQPVLDLNEKSQLPGSQSNESFLTIFNDDLKSGAQPLATLLPNSYPPPFIASNTNKLRIEVNQLGDFTANFTQFPLGCHSTAVGDRDSYLLTGCNALCSWFIPSRNNPSGTFVLQILNLNLPTVGDSLLLENINHSAVLSLKGPLSTMAFPDIDLNPKDGYVLYIKREACPATSNDNIISASFTYFSQNLLVTCVNLTANSSQSVTPRNYPNLYSINSNQIWKIAGNNSQNASSILVSFRDLQLKGSHKLTLNGQHITKTFDNNTISLPQDFVFPNPIIMNLQTDGPNDLSPFSGRGFDLNFELIDCGSTVNASSGTIKTPNAPDAFNHTKCIWIITVPDAPAGSLNIISFNYENGTKGNASNGFLEIYDANSVRENLHIFNSSYFNVSTNEFNSSTNSIVVIYSRKDITKDAPSFTLNFNTSKCIHLCNHLNRCLLPQFWCNSINDCGDFSDERQCNGTMPPPPTPVPPPAPIINKSGVNGWVVLFIICPLSIGLGVAATIFGPTLLSRFRRGGRYSEFQDFSEVS